MNDEIKLTTHGCGKTWKQIGDWTSHCGGCHETFSSLSLFDKHFERAEGGALAHRDPATMTVGRDSSGAKLPLMFDGTYGDGVWKSAAKWDPSEVFG